MFKNLNDVVISTDFFGENKELKGLLSHKINIVFGENGSGKSTIAEAFRQYSQGNVDYISFPGASIDEDDRKRIFVFDEQFVRQNLEMSEKKGLGTIVTIGDAVSISQEEFDLKKKIQDEEDKLTEAQSKASTAKTTADKLYRDLDTSFRKDNGYAGLGKQINEQANKLRVNVDDLVPKLSKLNTAGLDKIELRKEIELGIINLQSTKNHPSISWEPSLSGNSSVVPASARAKELLAKKIEKPGVSEREERLLALGEFYRQQTQTEIIDKEAKICPLCHQAITAEHRHDLKDLIAKVEENLKAAASGYEAALEECINNLTPEQFSIPEDVKSIFPAESTKAELAFKTFETEAESLIGKVKVRQNNILAEPSVLNIVLLNDYYTELSKSINALKTKIGKYNKDVKEREAKKTDLVEKNEKLAYLENENDIVAYLKSRADEKAGNDEADALESGIKTLRKNLVDVQAKSSNTNDARVFINECLDFIFCTKGRLELVPEGEEEKGVYTLKSNGRPVRLDKISVGERNAIALAYFFASTFTGKRKNDRYNTSSLYIIDDPISSFDRGNRVGMLSFINDQFTSIVDERKRADNKILVLSHDIQTVNDLSVIKDNLSKLNNLYEQGCLELKGKAIKPLVFNKESNYHQLLMEVFDFAAESEAAPDKISGIGNKMRQVMESFFKFNYNMPFEMALHNKAFLEQVPNNQKNYFNRFVAKLLFNTTSHGGANVDALGDFQPVYTADDLHIAARTILVFINYLNPLHLKMTINRERTRDLSLIDDWKKTLPTRSI